MINHLYDEIAKRWIPENGSIWVISDTHFGDLDCYKLRFPDAFPIPEGMSEEDCKLNHEHRVETFDNEQIKNINSKVGKNGTLIILGDLGDVSYVKKLKARYKILLCGNHDKGASNYKRVVECIRRCPKCGCTTLEDASYQSGNGTMWYKDKCTKCGFIGDTWGPDFEGTTDNHLFDEVYEGPVMINDRVILSHEPIMGYGSYLFNIHGHTHNADYKGDSHHLNCCAEAIDYTPINLIKTIKNGLLKDVDSIHRMTIDNATVRKLNKQKSNKVKK